jgi:hypothetical protein
MFKLIVIICLIATIFSSYVALQPLNQHIVLQEGSKLAFESGPLYGVFLSVQGDDCATITEGRCGKIIGLNLYREVSYLSLNTIFTQNDVTNWSLVHNQDFFCIRNDKFDAFLTLFGDDCLNITTTGTQCGQIALFKTALGCTADYGWRITTINNSYVLQSVKYPNVYFYFDGSNCRRINTESRSVRAEYIYKNRRICGQAVGVFMADTQGLLHNGRLINNWALFNLYPLTGNSELGVGSGIGQF